MLLYNSNAPSHVILRVFQAIFCSYTTKMIYITLIFLTISLREMQKGDEIAWYADGETTVRSEFNAATGYVFGRSFFFLF